MPREIVHWQVAERAGQLLASGPLGPALARCPGGLRYGAVFHDVLYYLHDGRGRHPQAVRELPGRLHGTQGEDTFELLRLYAPHLYARQDSPLPQAFFVGLAAHIFTDAALHPLVYHFTGNYHDADPVRRSAAVRRHRVLEALMDMAAAGGPAALTQRSLKEVVHSLEGQLALACPPELLGRLAGVDPAAVGRALDAALQTHCTMQALARRPRLAGLLRGLSGMLPGRFRELAALFYAPQLWGQRAAVAGELAHCNPATGKASTLTLAGLMELAAHQTAEFCSAQAPMLLARGELTGSAPGPSLDLGLPGAVTSQARHFALLPLLQE